MTFTAARACEFAVVPRCRCVCAGKLHGRGLEPQDARVPMGDPHWAGVQLGLFGETVMPLVGRYRARPVVIEAIRWTGENPHEVIEFTRDAAGIKQADLRHGLSIFTLEGTMHADIGDWIIKGTIGEFYPCKDDVFRRKYEAVEDGAGSLEPPAPEHVASA